MVEHYAAARAFNDISLHGEVRVQGGAALQLSLKSQAINLRNENAIVNFIDCSTARDLLRLQLVNRRFAGAETKPAGWTPVPAREKFPDPYVPNMPTPENIST